MKYFFVTLSVILFQFSGISQNSSNKKEETLVASRVETFRNALIDADAKTLKALTSIDLSYGHSSGLVQNQAAFIEKIISGESHFVTIEFQNQTITILGNVAIVRHNLVAHTKDSGIDKDIKIGNVLVWQKKNKQWLLIARQAFKLPS